MKFFKRILKYSVYIFISVWIFIIGVIVGRGNSPVKFDTQKFQKRLETIASNLGEQKKNPDKIDFKFYEILDRPDLEEEMTHDAALLKKNKEEIIPLQEVVKDSIPVKTSKKKETFKKSEIKLTKEDISRIKQLPEDKKKNKLENLKGRYTVQIAAFKVFTDAVSQMTALESKGFSSYNIKVQKDGITWYRVRSGSFTNFNEAKKLKQKLEKFKINPIIIKLNR
jgi:cell division protein FtsN